MESSGISSSMRYKQDSLLDKKFEALSNGTRLAIIGLLKKQPLYAGEIANYCSTSFASMSHHLKKLEQSNLIVVEKMGQHRKYMLNGKAFEGIYLWISDLIE